MLTIWKYQFEIQNEFSLSLPRGSTILKFGNQNETPTLWVLLYTEAKEQTLRKFYLFGTGHEIPDDPRLEYIGTEQFQLYVWHLFEGAY